MITGEAAIVQAKKLVNTIEEILPKILPSTHYSNLVDAYLKQQEDIVGVQLQTELLFSVIGEEQRQLYLKYKDRLDGLDKMKVYPDDGLVSKNRDELERCKQFLLWLIDHLETVGVKSAPAGT